MEKGRVNRAVAAFHFQSWRLLANTENGQGGKRPARKRSLCRRRPAKRLSDQRWGYVATVQRHQPWAKQAKSPIQKGRGGGKDMTIRGDVIG